MCANRARALPIQLLGEGLRPDRPVHPAESKTGLPLRRHHRRKRNSLATSLDVHFPSRVALHYQRRRVSIETNSLPVRQSTHGHKPYTRQFTAPLADIAATRLCAHQRVWTQSRVTIPSWRKGRNGISIGRRRWSRVISRILPRRLNRQRHLEHPEHLHHEGHIRTGQLRPSQPASHTQGSSPGHLLTLQQRQQNSAKQCGRQPVGVTDKRKYWFFDPFTGRDLNSCYRDDVEPQVWHRGKDINGDETRRAQRNRYDALVLEMRGLCHRWVERQNRQKPWPDALEDRSAFFW